MAKFVVDVHSVQTDVIRVELEANSLNDAIDKALYTDEGAREITETIVELIEPEQVSLFTTSALNLVGFKWSPFRAKKRGIH